MAQRCRKHDGFMKSLACAPHTIEPAKVGEMVWSVSGTVSCGRRPLLCVGKLTGKIRLEKGKEEEGVNPSKHQSFYFRVIDFLTELEQQTLSSSTMLESFGR